MSDLKASLAASGIVIGAILTICGIIGSFLWPYTLNEWLIFFGKEPNVVWWQGFILGFVPVLGQITIPAAVATWILMMFI